MKMDRSSLYEAFGSRDACHKLSAAFYARVDHDPLLRPLFPGTTLKCAIEEFAAFLAQFLGGPGEDMQRRWWLSLRESHARFRLGQKERDAWIANMALALDDVPVGEPMRGELLGFFEQSSAYIVNPGESVVNSANEEIACRWGAQARLDKAVAAIRRGDTKRAIELAESPALSTYSASVTCGLLALMVRSEQAVLLDYVRAKLTGNPGLIRERFAGRTLLHGAAAAGSLTIVELLLGLGADPDAPDGGGHTPLYSVGNECGVAGAERVVRALVQAGADVNAHDGVKHCTPLHMAARRGNTEVARALLDCGADIEARDSAGETPLRRSVNCAKVEVAKLFIARGADIHSVGSKGRTPLLAARNPAMKLLLQDRAT